MLQYEAFSLKNSALQSSIPLAQQKPSKHRKFKDVLKHMIQTIPLPLYFQAVGICNGMKLWGVFSLSSCPDAGSSLNVLDNIALISLEGKNSPGWSKKRPIHYNQCFP